MKKISTLGLTTVVFLLISTSANAGKSFFENKWKSNKASEIAVPTAVNTNPTPGTAAANSTTATKKVAVKKSKKHHRKHRRHYKKHSKRHAAKAVIEAENSTVQPAPEQVEAIEVKTDEVKSSTKTAGHFVNLDAVFTRGNFNERYTRNTKPNPVNAQPSYHNQGIGGSLGYKYAFNFNGFFVAPGVFFEHNNTEIRGSEGNSRAKVNIKDRYGFKTDIGYDVTNIFAPYLTTGYNRISYSTQNYSSKKTYFRDASNNDWFYGAGFKIRYSDHVAFNAEYNRQSFLAQTLLTNSVGYLGYYKTSLNIFKVGVSYNF